MQNKDFVLEIDKPFSLIDKHLEHLTDVNTQIILKKVKDGTWQDDIKPAEDVSKE